MTTITARLLSLAIGLLLFGCTSAIDLSQISIEVTPSPSSRPTAQASSTTWWNDHVFYEIFVRSFQDSDGDGMGDLQGLISRLDYLNDGDSTTDTDLGITGIWLMPISESPSYHGYDVVDYRTIEKDYGTDEDFRQLMTEAHKRGIKVIVDLVTNHTAVQHPWFSAATTPGSAYDSWYVWETDRPTYRGPWGQNVWHKSGNRYYYGVFWQGMPDLNYDNPAVTTEMHDIARFWLEDMGVDGFRLDAIKHLIEDKQRQENTTATHNWLAEFHDHAKAVSPEALLVGEIWSPSSQVATYVDDEVDIAFEFDLASAMLAAVNAQSKQSLERTQKQVSAAYPAGQYATFLSNHDQERVMSQLKNDPASSKLAATLLLTNPGVPFIYYGEEIGMVGRKPDERLRTPMQWNTTEDTAGFTDDRPWQALTSTYRESNVASQIDETDSLLAHYRALIHLRNTHGALRHGALTPVKTDKRGIYSFIRHQADDVILVVLNLSDKPADDYQLSLDEGPLTNIGDVTILFGREDAIHPTLNDAGGFEPYTPAPLPPQSSLIVRFGM